MRACKLSWLVRSESSVGRVKMRRLLCRTGKVRVMFAGYFVHSRSVLDSMADIDSTSLLLECVTNLGYFYQLAICLHGSQPPVLHARPTTRERHPLNANDTWNRHTTFFFYDADEQPQQSRPTPPIFIVLHSGCGGREKVKMHTNEFVRLARNLTKNGHVTSSALCARVWINTRRRQRQTEQQTTQT